MCCLNYNWLIFYNIYKKIIKIEKKVFVDSGSKQTHKATEAAIKKPPLTARKNAKTDQRRIQEAV